MGCELTLPTDPTTAAAARPMDVAFFASVLRDFYNGTKYDMSASGNLAAGPWGDPDRYGTWDSTVKGSWERSIGVYRTAYAHITQVHFSPQRSQSRLHLVVADPAFFGSVRRLCFSATDICVSSGKHSVQRLFEGQGWHYLVCQRQAFHIRVSASSRCTSSHCFFNRPTFRDGQKGCILAFQVRICLVQVPCCLL